MPYPIPLPALGCIGVAGKTSYYGKFLTTTSGTLSTVPIKNWEQPGFTLAKVAATNGRYTIQLPGPYRRFLKGHVTLLGPDTAAWGAKAKGINYFFRDNDIDTGSGNPAGSGSDLSGTIELQFTNPSTDATNHLDSELPDGTAFIVELEVERG